MFCLEANRFSDSRTLDQCASIKVYILAANNFVSTQVALAQDWMERSRTLPYTLSLFMPRDEPDYLSEISLTNDT